MYQTNGTYLILRMVIGPVCVFDLQPRFFGSEADLDPSWDGAEGQGHR